MKITPIDIAHKSFSKKMWGADEAELNDFLQQVAAAMEELIHERNNLKEQIRDRDLRLKDSEGRDHALKNTISTAGQMVERLRGDAEREAKLIIADAHQKAEMIVRDSRESLKKAYTEVSDLKRMRLQFQANLKALAQAHLSLVESGERFMPSVQLPNATLENEVTAQISPLASK